MLHAHRIMCIINDKEERLAMNCTLPEQFAKQVFDWPLPLEVSSPASLSDIPALLLMRQDLPDLQKKYQH